MLDEECTGMEEQRSRVTSIWNYWFSVPEQMGHFNLLKSWKTVCKRKLLAKLRLNIFCAIYSVNFHIQIPHTCSFWSRCNRYYWWKRSLCDALSEWWKKQNFFGTGKRRVEEIMVESDKNIKPAIKKAHFPVCPGREKRFQGFHFFTKVIERARRWFLQIHFICSEIRVLFGAVLWRHYIRPTLNGNRKMGLQRRCATFNRCI